MQYKFRLHGKIGEYSSSYQTFDIKLNKDPSKLSPINNGDDIIFSCFDDSSRNKRLTLRFRVQNKEVKLACPSDQTDDEVVYNLYLCGIISEKELNLPGITTIPKEHFDICSEKVLGFLRDKGFA
jgi:hypothetical protein